VAEFHCSLVTPEHQLIDAKVSYASVPTWDGLVGVAPQHAPLVAKLGDGAMRLDLADGGKKWFYVGGGFLQMQGDHLSILASEAVPAEKVNRQEAEAALREAEARQAIKPEDQERRQHEITRAKTMISIAQHA